MTHRPKSALCKPTRSAEAVQWFASELAAPGGDGTFAAGLTGSALRLYAGRNFVGSSEHLTLAVEASTLRFVDSSTLAGLGLFGRMEALLQDFGGVGLVIADQLPLLALQQLGLAPPGTQDMEIGRVTYDVPDPTGEFLQQWDANAAFPFSPAGHGVLGSLLTAQGQFTQHTGLYDRTDVNVGTHSDGATIATVDVHIAHGDESALARYEREVEPALRALAASLDHVTLRETVELDAP